MWGDAPPSGSQFSRGDDSIHRSGVEGGRGRARHEGRPRSPCSRDPQRSLTDRHLPSLLPSLSSQPRLLTRDAPRLAPPYDDSPKSPLLLTGSETPSKLSNLLGRLLNREPALRTRTPSCLQAFVPGCSTHLRLPQSRPTQPWLVYSAVKHDPGFSFIDGNTRLPSLLPKHKT